MDILISGGAGFVGASLARLYRQHQPKARVVVLDNLKRRGSELNLPIFKEHNIEFVHGDIRSPHDFDGLGRFDLFVEASAEPSVLAGADGNAHYLVNTNLTGTLHALEFARKNAGAMVFLSTSRVYGIPALRALPLVEGPTRFMLNPNALPPGCTVDGLNESFSVAPPRSLYGSTKLASELMIEEYAASFNMRVVINRCGVICGPGQFGKVDQGVFTLWVANHYFGKPLRYTGFGGTGKQVRDLLHPRDLFALLNLQTDQLKPGQAPVYNVGGGRHSVSLLEMTRWSQEATGKSITITPNPETHAVDIPFYVSDNRLVTQTFGWSPQVTPQQSVGEIAAWLKQEEPTLKHLFA